MTTIHRVDRRVFDLILMVILLLCCAGGLRAAECIRNGSFDRVLAYWHPDAALGNNLPYQDPQQCVALERNGTSGDVFRQPLNVDGIAGQTVTVQMDVGAQWAPSGGRSVSVYLDYMSSSGTLHRVQVLSPDNGAVPDHSPVDPATFATFASNHTFSADADRLVGLALASSGWDTFYVNNVSLTGSGLTPGPVPYIEQSTFTPLAYGDTLTVTGHGFGGEGVLMIGGATSGVTVASWSDTQISATVGPPCRGGDLGILANGIANWQRRRISIDSPHYTATLSEDAHIAIAGQELTIPIAIRFEVGYATTGLWFSVSDRQAFATFTPAARTNAGATVLSYDTTGLPAGIHTYDLLGTDAFGTFPIGRLSVDIRQVDHINIWSGGSAITNTPITDGKALACDVNILDTEGRDIAFDVPTPVWSSTDPSVAIGFRDRPAVPWGNFYILPFSNGTATLIATFPDASTFGVPVTVNMPDSPRMTSLTLTMPTMSNDPMGSNHLFFASTHPMTEVGANYSELSLDLVDTHWGAGNLSVLWDYVLSNDHQKPGAYLLRGNATVSTGSGSAGVGRGCLLTIYNDPATGLVTGDAFDMSWPFPEISGTLDFFSPGDTNTSVLTLSIWEGSSRYRAARVPPGVYLVRFMADDGTPQWYPYAASPDGAVPITVTAGGVVDDIDFIFAPEVPQPPPIDTEPRVEPGDLLTYGVETRANVEYLIQKSYTLREGSWFTVGTLFGTGGSREVSQDISQSGHGYFRVIPK